MKGRIVNIDAAKRYADEVTAIMEQINRSARVLRETCEGDELAMHLRRLARVAASLTTDVCNPLFSEYPQVKPPDYLL